MAKKEASVEPKKKSVAAPKEVATKAATPKAATPKATASKVAAPKVAAPKTDTPKETPKAATTPKEVTPKAAAPKAATPKAAAPKAAAPKAETPEVAAPKAAEPKAATSKAATPKAAAPKAETPKAATPKAAAPKAAPKAAAPKAAPKTAKTKAAAPVAEPVVEQKPVAQDPVDKGEPNDGSVETKLANLYKLQLMLSEIDKIKTLRGELPFEVQDLEDEVAGLQTRIRNFQLDAKDLDTAIGQQRIKITDSNALIAKYQQQLENVRNNREFDSLSKEIEYQGLEVELAEKRIREFTADAKILAEEIQKCKKGFEERQGDLKSKKEELNEIISETKIQEEQMREKAKLLETKIEPRLLAAFKRIRKSARNGLGVVYIQRGSCGGCFNSIPPQRQLDIKLRKKTIVCEHCGRIIIDPELAGVETA